MLISMTTPPTEYHDYTWNDIEEKCAILADKIYEKTKNQKVAIIGIARGGLIPATLIAQLLGEKFIYSVGISSYYGFKITTTNTKISNVVESYKEKSTTYQFLSPAMFQYFTHFVFVDDISDSGDTFDSVEKIYNSIAPANTKMFTAAICVKECSSFIPTFYVDRFKPNIWVRFCWEKKKYKGLLSSSEIEKASVLSSVTFEHPNTHLQGVIDPNTKLPTISLF